MIATVIVATSTRPREGDTDAIPFELVPVVYAWRVERSAKPLVRRTHGVFNELANVKVEVEVDGKARSRWGEVEERVVWARLVGSAGAREAR